MIAMRSIAIVLAIVSLEACQKAYLVDSASFAQRLIDNSHIALTAPDGSRRELSEILASHAGTVLIFWQTSCPCVKRYQARVNHLYARYNPHGIGFFHIFSNEREVFLEAWAEYQRRKIPLPLFWDEKKKLADLLRVKGTPTAALLNHNGDLVFLGWIDNERTPGESGRIPYLENALTEMMDDRPISTPTSPMFGCSID